MQIDPISPAGGAVVTGIDLKTDLSPENANSIRNAFLEYGVIAIRDQNMEADDQIKFCNAMGGIAVRGKPANQRANDGDSAYNGAVHIVTNLTEDGKPLGSFGDGEVWFHHDGSFQEIPYAATVLYGISVTSTGGETAFANMFMAFDRLSDEMKKQIEELKGLNIYDYASTGRVALDQDISNINHWVHPLVIRHPDTGRRALYVSPLMTARVEGIPAAESDALLNELFTFQDDEEIIFEHKWEAGDLVMMDNRSITHARRNFPAGEPRMLRRTMVEGVPLEADDIAI
ncbi:MAG: Alpha-ketoglutarate-dependent 2,4-dichlorophenoxyacetate dioxygenase [Alphaproteobacteria bacterium MarineAlpha11_Bin1]|nr:MAG: Alpha-ketoglutarate-dependent 2,4-dichlorophenoxyacetate dioxygenase [Alphaproteobacteria bacterium MarineAlpha11_Bin1]|tara:strand:+ start:10612 stop:11472 length:861 start_codon:yes stop_codon:yes gene_type:complete